MVSLEGPAKVVEIKPPHSLFFGTVFEAATSYVDNLEADINFRQNDPTNPQFNQTNQIDHPDYTGLIAGYRQKLASGDEELAERLRGLLLSQIDEINDGDRYTITGEAHLMRERYQQASRGVMFYVRNHNLVR